jgi:hypothetical protein
MNVSRRKKPFAIAKIACCIALSVQNLTAQAIAPIQFIEGTSGRAGKLGARKSFTNYRTRSGVKVTRNIISYQSEKSAHADLVELISRNVLVRRGVKFDSKGNKLGERVLLKTREKGEVVWKILWQDRKSLYLIKSKSVETAEAFENQTYPSAFGKK